MQPLDDFCRVTHKEILRIIGHRMPTPESWLLSAENHPLAPECELAASDLMKMPEKDVRRILAKGCHIRLSSRNLATTGNGTDLNSVVTTDTIKVENEEELRSMIRNA